MMFSTEGLSSTAMLVFGRDRLVSVLCNSPIHAERVAVVELVTTKDAFEGAICLRDIVHFAGLINLNTSDIFVREQSNSAIELWLYKQVDDYSFDLDPTPVEDF